MQSCGADRQLGQSLETVNLQYPPGETDYALVPLAKPGTVSVRDSREFSQQDLQGEIAALPCPDDMDEAEFESLRRMLSEAIPSTAGRLMSTPPSGESNEILQLLLDGSDAEGWRLMWFYKNKGDYDQNGEVNVSDLTPIGRHLGANSEDEDWLAASRADGDENGEVGISDITPIGQHFLSQVVGYNAYGADDPSGPWEPVASGDLPQLPADRPVMLFLELPGLDYDYYHICARDAGGQEADPSVPAGIPIDPPQVTPGSDVMVATEAIGPLGGSIEGSPGSPVEGIRVDFPAGALPTDTAVSIGYNTGTVEFNGVPLESPILSLECAGPAEFEKPVLITVPSSDELPPSVLYLHDDGSYEGVHLTEFDEQASTFSFETWHASSWFWLYLDSYIGVGPKWRMVTTGYASYPDGFAAENTHSEYTGGNCFGMSVFSQWYFMEKYYESDGRLFDSFRELVSNGDPLVLDPMAQQVISTRAQLSVERFWKEYGIGGYGRAYVAGNAYNYNALRNMLLITEMPQTLILTQTIPDDMNGSTDANHAVLAYGIVDREEVDEVNILIFDPNLPAKFCRIKYNKSQEEFVPYPVGNTVYDRFIYFGTGSIRYAESFYDILVDARHNFEDSMFATIDVQSHESGAHVDEHSVDLYGKVHSSEVLVEKLGIKNEGFYVELELDNSGEFRASVPVHRDKNLLIFSAIGYDEHNVRRYLHHNLLTNPFTLYGDFEPNALLIELNWDYNPQMSCNMYIRNEQSGEYMCYILNYTELAGGGEFWRNPTIDPTGYGPEYGQWEFTDPVFNPEAYPDGQDIGVYVICTQFNPTLGLDSLNYRVVVTSLEGTASESRQVFNGAFSAQSQYFPMFNVPPWQLVTRLHLGAQ